tara:strand:+ start:466 stop:1260 length:795 start_codon:yes stop_codon:yes gene_type:complete
MKIVFITGDHLRHRYMSHSLSDNSFEIFRVFQKREDFVPQSPVIIDKNLGDIYKKHFNKRQNAELNFFNEVKVFKGSKNIFIESQDFNNGTLLKIVSEIRPDIILSYGCNLLSEDILKLAKVHTLNIHGGLSPWYRGTATHFWPSYFLEPQFTGITLHFTSMKIDGGNIVHQSAINPQKQDGIHEHACRNVKFFADQLNQIILQLTGMDRFSGISQENSGKLWTNNMWKPSHLKIIHELFDDKINKYCIENNLIDRKPKLISLL